MSVLPGGCTQIAHFSMQTSLPASLGPMHQVLEPALDPKQCRQRHVLHRASHSAGLPEFRAQALQLALQLGHMRTFLQELMGMTNAAGLRLLLLLLRGVQLANNVRVALPKMGQSCLELRVYGT